MRTEKMLKKEKPSRLERGTDSASKSKTKCDLREGVTNLHALRARENQKRVN